jgi:hypothetical protein
MAPFAIHLWQRTNRGLHELFCDTAMKEDRGDSPMPGEDRELGKRFDAYEQNSGEKS